MKEIPQTLSQRGYSVREKCPLQKPKYYGIYNTYGEAELILEELEKINTCEYRIVYGIQYSLDDGKEIKPTGFNELPNPAGNPL